MKFRKSSIILIICILFFTTIVFSSCANNNIIIVYHIDERNPQPHATTAIIQNPDTIYIDFYFRGGRLMYYFVDSEHLSHESTYTRALNSLLNSTVGIPNWHNISTTYNRFVNEGLFKYSDRAHFRGNFVTRRSDREGFNSFYYDGISDERHAEMIYQWRTLGPDDTTPIGRSYANTAFRNLVDVLSQPERQNRLSVITMNFYDEGGDFTTFIDLYANAFRNGMSGSMIVVRSNYFGLALPRIGPNQINIVLPNDRGEIYSYFYIMVIGPTNQVQAYTQNLTNTLISDGITDFNYIYFLPLNQKINSSDIHVTNPIYDRRQNIDNYLANTVNAGLREEGGRPVSIRQNRISVREYIREAIEQGYDESEYEAYNEIWQQTRIADVFSFAPIPNGRGSSTRYILGIPVGESGSDRAIVRAFAYMAEADRITFNTLSTANNRTSDTATDLLGTIEINVINSSDEIHAELAQYSTNARRLQLSEDTNLIYVEIYIHDNSILPRENIRVNIPISYVFDFSEIPTWVRDISVSTVEELRLSIVERGEIKILNFMEIYRGIFAALNEQAYDLKVYILNN